MGNDCINIPDRANNFPLVQFDAISYYENGSIESEGLYVAPYAEIELDVEEIGITKHYEVNEKMTKSCDRFQLASPSKPINPKFTDKLVRNVETWVTSSMKAGKITPEEGREFLSNYRSGLYGYTYLEKA